MLMRNRIAILLIGLLVLAVAPFCSAQSDESTHGKSATGKISWEIRPPAGDGKNGYLRTGRTLVGKLRKMDGRFWTLCVHFFMERSTDTAGQRHLLHAL